MKYLLDTDHLSVFQRRTGQAYLNLAARMASCPASDFAVSIVTFHEQLLGTHAYINRARRTEDVARGYKMMAQALRDFIALSIVDFDSRAAQIFDQLNTQKLQVATMDTRIAAIALSQDLILLTRNQQDFGKVPSLKMQDWTI